MSDALSFSAAESTLHGVNVDLATFLDGKLAKMNKRLAKLGAPAATLTYGPVVERRERTEWGTTAVWHEFDTVTVTGVEAKFAGWTGVATLDHTLDADEALVSKFPGQEDTPFDEAFRFRGPVCDHCGIAIKRNLTILFVHEDGRWMQVGTSCVRDFIGVDPATVLWLSARSFGFDDDDCDDEGRRYGGGHFEVQPLDFIAAASECTRLFGFVKSRPDDAYKSPTREGAATLCRGRLNEYERKMYRDVEWDRGRAEAEKVMAWVAESTDTSDFMTSARLACRTWKVTDKTEGLLACLPFVWEREMGKVAERDQARKASGKVDGWKGEVKGKLTVEGVVTFKMAFEPYHYGGPTTYRITMLTDDGYTVTTLGGGNTLWECAVGDRVEMSGKVKEHSDDARYGKQTVVQMAKVRVLAEAASE